MYTVEQAYKDIYKREKTYATFKGLSEDQANRHAAKQAVRYAWIEFNVARTSYGKL